MTPDEVFQIGKQDSPLTKGVRGMVDGFVFRQLNGVTVCSRRPSKPVTRSARQCANTSRFRQAASFARKEMLDPERKAYYQEIAVRERLPNAYTAAIKCYMRSPDTIVAVKRNLAVEADRCRESRETLCLHVHEKDMSHDGDQRKKFGLKPNRTRMNAGRYPRADPHAMMRIFARHRLSRTHGLQFVSHRLSDFETKT